MTDLSEMCSRNNWYNTLVLRKNIAIFAINSNGINLSNKVSGRNQGKMKKEKKIIDKLSWSL